MGEETISAASATASPTMPTSTTDRLPAVSEKADSGSVEMPESRWVNLNGPTHYLDFGGPENAPAMVLVHGIKGSYANWLAVGSDLANHYRVFAIDLIGHGRTEAETRHGGVRSNQRMLNDFLEEVVGRPALLVGNSMGGLVSILQAEAHGSSVSGLVLISPAMLPPLAPTDVSALAGFLIPAVVPFFAEGLMARDRCSTKPSEQVGSLLELAGVDPDTLDRDVVQEHVNLAEERQSHRGADRAHVQAARTMLATLLDVPGHAARTQGLSVPVLLVHGDQDRLIPVAAARRAAQSHADWSYVEMPGVGHAPQLEDAAAIVRTIRTWTDQVNLTGGRTATGI